jgi:hypothetical protein
MLHAEMRTSRPLRRITRAERVSVSFTDAGGGLRLPLASRRALIPGLAAAVAFLVVTSIAWQRLSSWRRPPFDSWLHGALAVLGVLWLAVLWAGAIGLLILAVVLLFYRESARLADSRLIHVTRIGPAHVVMESELAKVRNLRAAEAGKDRAVIRFDYDDGDHRLGDDMTPAEAAARVKMVQAAIDALGARRPSQAGATVPRPAPGP